MNEKLVAALEAAGVGFPMTTSRDLPRIASTVAAWPEAVKRATLRTLFEEWVRAMSDGDIHRLACLIDILADSRDADDYDVAVADTLSLLAPEEADDAAD